MGGKGANITEELLSDIHDLRNKKHMPVKRTQEQKVSALKEVLRDLVRGSKNITTKNKLSDTNEKKGQKTNNSFPNIINNITESKTKIRRQKEKRHRNEIGKEVQKQTAEKKV